MPSPDPVPEPEGGETCWLIRTYLAIDPDPEVAPPMTLAEARANLDNLRLMQPEHIHRLVRVEGDGTCTEEVEDTGPCT